MQATKLQVWQTSKKIKIPTWHNFISIHRFKTGKRPQQNAPTKSPSRRRLAEPQEKGSQAAWSVGEEGPELRTSLKI